MGAEHLAEQSRKKKLLLERGIKIAAFPRFQNCSVFATLSPESGGLGGWRWWKKNDPESLPAHARRTCLLSALIGVILQLGATKDSQSQELGVARGPLQERPLQFQHGNVRVKSWKLATHLGIANGGVPGRGFSRARHNPEPRSEV